MKKTAVIDGITVSYIEEGEGAPLLLLHGWGCNGGHWQPVIDAFQCDHRVIAPDIPGFGDSTEPPATWGSRDFAALFTAFLREIGMEKPVICGHSNGGRIAILLAAAGLAEKVILTDSAGVKPRRSASYYAKVYSYKAMKKALSLPGLKGMKEDILAKQRQKRGSADYNAASPTMKQILSTVVNEDLLPAVGEISVPTLLIWGSEDTATPLADGEAMTAALKANGTDAALVTFDGAGHFAFLEEKNRFINVMRAFI